jgi:large repetitive protein
MLKRIFFYIFIFITILNAGAQCPLSVQIISDKQIPVCKNTLVNFNAEPSIGAVNPQYIWTFNGDTVSFDSTFSSTNVGQINLYMETTTGCSQNNASNIKYLLNVDVQVDYVSPEPTECNQPVNDISIIDISGGTEPYTYYLHTAEEDLAQSNYYSDLPISTYPLVVTDGEGCVDTTWMSMTTKECDPIIPSQIFTPNDDGFNDTWFIQNIKDYPKNKVYIFDRWGQRVYYKEGYDNVDGWDAKYIGGNLAVSTFYYVIELEFDKQDRQVFKGPVSILR